MKLEGKVALVTGSSRGIGRAVAVRLGRDGAAVVVNYAGNAEAAQGAVAAVEKAGRKAVAVQADVSRVADVERLFDTTFEHFGRLDILVNNAGILFNRPLADVTEEDFDRIFAVNVKGSYFACQQAARRMADGGRIINLSSTTTALMLPTYSAYVATKGPLSSCRTSWRRNSAPGGSPSTWSRRDRPIPNSSARTRPSRISSGSLSWRRWGGSGSQRTLPTWWRSWRVTRPAGSPGRTFGPTAGSSEVRSSGSRWGGDSDLLDATVITGSDG